jgi:hypothetical protein
MVSGNQQKLLTDNFILDLVYNVQYLWENLLFSNFSMLYL